MPTNTMAHGLQSNDPCTYKIDLSGKGTRTPRFGSHGSGGSDSLSVNQMLLEELRPTVSEQHRPMVTGRVLIDEGTSIHESARVGDLLLSFSLWLWHSLANRLEVM